MTAPELTTARLRLRHWRDSDRDPFAALNADPLVMEHFPAPLSRDQSDVLAELIDVGLGERDYGLWAVEVPGVSPFVGFVGLSAPTWAAAFTPCIEIGWRLDRSHWGRGYVTEAARAVLAYAFDGLGLDEVVSFTTLTNTPSLAVMQRIGMRRDPAEDFDHPNLNPTHPLARHLLCRISRQQWSLGSGQAGGVVGE